MKEKEQESSYGHLYIVPTPIGNLSDITHRAVTVLQYVDLIAAENIYYTGVLLRYLSIHSHLISLNKYNEQKKTKILVEKLKNRKNIALVSNAGTPLINDPGYYLVRKCREIGVRIIPLPGPCAAITALSASGLPTNRFYYEGFLPVRSKERCDTLKSLKTKQCTLIFYESTHRLLESLNDMVSILGNSRYVVLARELTKIWETIQGGPVGTLLPWVKENKNRSKGEIVLVVEGYKENTEELSSNVLRTLFLLRNELSLKKAAILTSEIHGVKKKILYKYALQEKLKI